MPKLAVATVLVTGGTGCLGRALVPKLLAAGHVVRVLSRSDAAEVGAATLVTGDLTSGDGIGAALDGAEVVVHAASSPFRRTNETDVAGTARLLEAAADAGVGHLLYTSIVGVDRHPFRYYRAKWAAEQIVEAGAVPWTIARATQFHDLLDQGLARVTRLPVVPVAAGFVFQPVDTAEYADVVIALVADGPAGRAPDTGGPEVRAFRDLVRTWLRAHGRRRPTLPLPLIGRSARAMKDGVHTCPERAVGTVTWEEYLARSG